MSAEPSSQPEKKSDSSSFWTSLPGLITAISGLLTALVAVGAFLYQIGGSDKDDSAAAAGDTPASSTRVSSSPSLAAVPSAAAAPSTAAGADGSLWHDTLLLTGSGVDFDSDPPNTQPGEGFDVYDAGDNKFSPGGSGALVAAWKRSGTPTAADCDDLLSREGIPNTGSLPRFYDGAKFCLRTNGAQKIVFITFVGQTSGNNRIDAVVWAPRD